MLVFPTIAVIQARQWGVPIADLLLLATPGFVLYGLGALPAGSWADRVGSSLPLGVGVLGMGVGLVICGLGDRLQIAIGLGVVGLCASTYHPVGLGLISRGCSRPAWALGVNGSFGSAAVAIAPGLGEILAEALGWRGAFLALAVPAAITGVAILMFPIRLSKEPTPDEAPAAELQKGPTRLFSRRFLLLCVGMTLGGLAYRGNSVVLPALFEERVAFMGPGIATSLTYSLAAGMNLLGGHLAERRGNVRIYLLFHALSLPALIATAWLSGIPLLLAGAIYAGAALGTQPAENSLVAQLSPRHQHGRAYGIKFTLSFGVGALAVPLVAWLLERHGTTAVMLALSVFIGGLVVVALTLSRLEGPGSG